MNTQANGFFPDKLNGMDASNKLPFFPKEFVGRCRIDATKSITTTKGQKAYIAEMTILTSNTSAVHVGGRYSWYQGIDPVASDTAYQACIGFLLAAFGLDPVRDRDAIDKEFKPNQAAYLNASVNEDPNTVFSFLEVDPATGQTVTVKRNNLVNILAGREVNLQTTEKAKKAGKKMPIEEARAKGEVFTLHSFSPVAPAAATAAA